MIDPLSAGTISVSRSRLAAVMRRWWRQSTKILIESLSPDKTAVCGDLYRNPFGLGPFSFGRFQHRLPMRYVDALFALKTRRVVSVDALRGFSIFWIIGADGAIWTLDRMLRSKGPALNSVGSFLGTQMSHAEWAGFRFYDLIFPLFIFVTGVSIVLALPRLVEREGMVRTHTHVLRRAL